MWLEPYQFIKYHVKINKECKKYYPQCPPPCSKIFYEESNLQAHQQRSAATSSCYKSYSNKLLSNESAIKYTTSEVEIPIREEKNIYSQKKSPESIPPSINFQDNIMLSKRMNFKSNQFMPSIAFINKNIHHLKTTIP